MNEIKLSDLASQVLANVDTALRSEPKGSGVARGEKASGKLPVAFINAARRAAGRNADETTPSIERAIDRKRGEE
jgi:hypothetical protein